MRKSIFGVLLFLIVGCLVACDLFPVFYTLTIEIQGEGLVTPVSGSEFKEGTAVTLSTMAKEGWVFDRWDGQDKDLTVEDKKIAMTKNMQLKAVFVEASKLPMYTLTIDIIGEGLVMPISGSEFKEGTTVPLSTLAKDGWVFDRWDGQDKDLVAENKISITKDMKITAVFVEDEVITVPNTVPTVTLSANTCWGKVPLRVNFKAVAEDVEDDQLSFRWEIEGDSTNNNEGLQVHSSTKQDSCQYVFEQIGSHKVEVFVSDGFGESSDSMNIEAWGLIETQMEWDGFQPEKVLIEVDQVNQILYVIGSSSESSILGTFRIDDSHNPVLSESGWITFAGNISKFILKDEVAWFLANGQISATSLFDHQFSNNMMIYPLNSSYTVNDMAVKDNLLITTTVNNPDFEEKCGIEYWDVSSLGEFKSIGKYYLQTEDWQTYKLKVEDNYIYLSGSVPYNGSRNHLLYKFEYQFDGTTILKTVNKKVWPIDGEIKGMEVTNEYIYLSDSKGVSVLNKDLSSLVKIIYGSYSNLVITDNYITTFDDLQSKIDIYKKGTYDLIGTIDANNVIDMYQNATYSYIATTDKVFWGYIPY